MSDLCDVCGAPATYWQRYGGHWDDEYMDRCGRHKPASDTRETPDVDAVIAQWRARAAVLPVDTVDELIMRQRGVEPPNASRLDCPHSTDRAVLLEGILTDLIAELRTAHHAQPYTLTEGHYCPVCQTRASRPGEADWPCDTARMSDRAEARLREVTDE